MKSFVNVRMLSASVPRANNILTPSAFLKHLTRLSRQTHYALAVSGGADSMALLGLAIGASKLKGAPQFTVLSVDHGLRPEARNETQMVVKWARDHGLNAKVLRHEGDKPRSAVQNWARNLRYDLMAGYCDKHAISALVTAHHMQDQAETFLMRLAKGSGLRGLNAMQPIYKRQSLLILRPMLSQMPEQLRSLCQGKNWPYIDDPSNVDMTYERVRVRNAWPELISLGLTPEMISDTAAKLSMVHHDLELQIDQLIASEAMFTELGVMKIPKTIFIGLTKTLQRGLLQRALSIIGGGDYPPSATSLEHMRLQAISDDVAALTLSGVQMRCRKHHILLGRETKKAMSSGGFVCPSAGAYIWDNRFFIQFEHGKKGRIIKGLGMVGLAQMRERDVALPKDVPSGYLAALPAVYIGENLLGCPSLAPISGVDVSIKV